MHQQSDTIETCLGAVQPDLPAAADDSAAAAQSHRFTFTFTGSGSGSGSGREYFRLWIGMRTGFAYAASHPPSAACGARMRHAAAH